MTQARFASVVLVEPSLSHLDRAFTYGVSEGMAVEVGSLVRAPFRGKRRRGIVVGLADEPDVERTLPLTEMIGPGLGPELVDLCRWVADRTLSTLGEALAAALPQRVVSEEARPPASSRIPKVPAFQWLVYAGARQGLNSPSGFVWRPRFDERRGAAVCDLVGRELSRGRSVLILIPEVRVSTDIVEALRTTFGDALAWLGSDAKARDRYRDWLALRSGAKRLAVGGRAAVFAPLDNLGLIVLDDEGHASYKEARAPRFHARAVAAERARRAGARLVLVGVPPSIEVHAAVERGSYPLVAPTRAAERTARPPVTVIDRAGERLVPTAMTLRMAARARDDGRRVVVIAHRGGDHVAKIAERTGRILDLSVTVLEAGAQPSAVRRAAQSARCIVATSFIAKDLALADVGLLALCDVDAPLAQAEYRAPEDAFATWWRAARWARGGHVAIETTQPDHAAVKALARWDPEALWRAEAARRREAGYPPFVALARVDVPAEQAAAAAAELEATGVEVLGPIPGAPSSVIVVRAKTRAVLVKALRPVVDAWRAAGAPMRVDVDPWEVLVPKWRSSRS